MPEGLDDVEKARYVYINLGKIFTIDENYTLGNSKSRYNFERYTMKEKIDFEKLKAKGNKYKGVCIHIAKIYGIVLESLGIGGYLVKESGRDQHRSNEVWIDLNKGKENPEEEKWLIFPADLQADLKNIQMHRRTALFGCNYSRTNFKISDERLEEIDKKIGYEYDGDIAIQKMISDYKKESYGLNHIEKIELYLRKLEQLPYFNKLGIVERKDMISTFKSEMLDTDEKNKFFTSYIFRKDEDNPIKRKDYIQLYSYLGNRDGKSKFKRYYYDENENIHKEITDEELVYFMMKHDYHEVKEIPGLNEKNKKNIYKQVLDKMNKRNKTSKNNENQKDFEDR